MEEHLCLEELFRVPKGSLGTKCLEEHLCLEERMRNEYFRKVPGGTFAWRNIYVPEGSFAWRNV
jgi:hypothetical protein